MVCRLGSNANNNIRLSRYINALQEYRFNITHRSGKAHIDADAVSRLLQADDVVVVNTAEDLSDNFVPLDTDEESFLTQRFPKDSSTLIDAINDFRVRRNLQKIIYLDNQIFEDTGTTVQLSDDTIEATDIHIGSFTLQLPHAIRDLVIATHVAMGKASGLYYSNKMRTKICDQ